MNKTQTHTHLSCSPPLQANSHSASVGSLRLTQWQYACASLHDTCSTGWFILDENTEIIFNIMTSTHRCMTYDNHLVLAHVVLFFLCIYLFACALWLNLVLLGVSSLHLSLVTTKELQPPTDHNYTLTKWSAAINARPVYFWLYWFVLSSCRRKETGSLLDYL